MKVEIKIGNSVITTELDEKTLETLEKFKYFTKNEDGSYKVNHPKNRVKVKKWFAS